jgi:hypothetical protein
MTNLPDIISENASTFYNYRTGRATPVWPGYVVVCLLAAFGAAAFNRPFSDLYAAFISAQAILVGFSFNVLVFLSSTRLIAANDPHVIEDVTKAAKLNRLSSEIFANLAYFNVVALVSIFLSLLLILEHASSLSPVLLLNSIGVQEQRWIEWVTKAQVVVRLTLLWLTYATVLEALATFTRVTRRVTYFFREKRDLSRSLASRET